MNEERKRVDLNKAFAPIAWIEDFVGLVPHRPPEELPSVSDPGFWREACRLEFSSRAELTRKIKLVSEDLSSLPVFSDLEAWMLNRRHEFAVNVVTELAVRSIETKMEKHEFAVSLLTEWWEEFGCYGFFEQAVGRDGKPHPDTPAYILKIIGQPST